MEQPSINSYKDLTVWQKSMDLVEQIYRISNGFPKSEVYGLTSQMRRCAVSIASNIAEGRRRGSKKEYQQFLSIALGSGAELETQLEISHRLKYTDNVDFGTSNELLTEVMKMLNKMLSTLKASS